MMLKKRKQQGKRIFQRPIFVFTLILLVSFMGMESGLSYETYFENENISIELLENTDFCLDKCHAKIKVCGIEANEITDFKLWFEDEEGNEIGSIATDKISDGKYRTEEMGLVFKTENKLNEYEIREEVKSIETIQKPVIDNKTEEISFVNSTQEYNSYLPYDPTENKNIDSCIVLILDGYRNTYYGDDKNVDWKVSINGLEPDWAWWNSTTGFARPVGVGKIIESINGTSGTDIDNNGLEEWIYCNNVSGTSYVYYSNENDTWCANDTHSFWMAQTEPIEQARGTQDTELLFFIPLDTSTDDYSGRNMDSTSSTGNPTVTATAKVNNAWDFDGNDGVLYPGETVTTTWVDTTILWFFRVTDHDDFDNFFTKTDPIFNNFMRCRIQDDDKLNCATDGDTGDQDAEVETTANVTTGAWHCAGWQINGTHGTLYFDSAIEGHDLYGGLTFGDGNMSIGGRYSNLEAWDRFLTGQIDNLIILDRLITLSEFQQFCAVNSTVGEQMIIPATTSTTTTTLPFGISRYETTSCEGVNLLVTNITTWNGTNFNSQLNATVCENNCSLIFDRARCNPDTFTTWLIWIVILLAILWAIKFLIKRNMFD